jgi:cardiolipin synthase
LLHDGAQAFPVMLEAIQKAEREILLEMYWFGSDATGRRFAEALIEKARQGVCVRVTYDAVGSIDASTVVFDMMREAGGLGFRDDAIEVVGSAAQELRALFYRTFPKPPSVVFPPMPLDGETAVSVLASDHWEERRGIYDGYLNAIARATREIIITNSYFIPAARVRRALARAVSRGVRVRVLVPRDSDVRIAQLASRRLYERLLADGIELYEWRGGILHSKTALVDDSWCTVGSFNFDARSIHNNLELNIAVRDRAVNQALRQRVELDLKDAIRVELDSFKRRGFLTKLLERFVYMFRWLL